MSGYAYPTSLDATRIRLLRFDVNNNSMGLRLFISEHSLEDIAPYHALSYTWGPPRDTDRAYEESDKVPITLNGARFDVFPNLYLALDQLRRHPPLCSQYHWIDAICINQMDIPERGAQVGIMDHIYGTAVQVNVWLGEEDGASSKVSMLVARMGLSWKGIRENVESGKPVVRLSNVGDNDSLMKYGLPAWTDEIWVEFVQFFRRSWFRRIWVIQEIALAKKTWLMLGESILDWTYVVACSHVLLYTGLTGALTDYAHRHPRLDNVEKFPTPGHQLGASIGVINFAQVLCQADTGDSSGALEWNQTVRLLDTMHGYRAGTTSERPLLFLNALLFMTQEFQCTDERDRVFALLGMVNTFARAQELPQLPFHPDYEPSSNSATVLTEITTAFLKQFEIASILTLVNHGSGHLPDNRPSWVPDFAPSKSSSIKKRQGQFEFDPCKYRPLGQLGLRVDASRLHLTAFQIDVIKVQTRSWIDMFEETHCEDLARLVLSSPSTYATTGQDRVEVLWRTIIYDRGKHSCPAEPGLRESFRCWLGQRIITAIAWETWDWSKRLKIVESLVDLQTLAESDSSQTIPPVHLLKSIVQQASEIPSQDRDFRNTSTLGQEEILYQGMAAYDELARFCLSYRRLFVTKSGYFGSGPEAMEPGDSAWIVSGCSSILIFREHPNDHGCYQLVGEAYIHGLMHGEAVKETTQWAEICLL